MARVNLKRPDGTSIVIEGAPREVAELVRAIQGEVLASDRQRRKPTQSRAKAKQSIPDMLMSLAHDGFFKKPKELMAVKTALAERGEIYPVTTVAPALLRLVRRKHLRRIRQDKKWFYTGWGI